MAPTTETLEEGGRSVQRISQGFRSILVMTCQPKFLRHPPPVKTTWPFFFSKCICGRPAGRVQLQFLYSIRRYSAFPWIGDKSDSGRGGDCSLMGDTTFANSGGCHMLGKSLDETQLLCCVFKGNSMCGEQMR